MEQSHTDKMEETRLVGETNPNQVINALEDSSSKFENSKKIDGAYSPPLEAIPEIESKLESKANNNPNPENKDPPQEVPPESKPEEPKKEEAPKIEEPKKEEPQAVERKASDANNNQTVQNDQKKEEGKKKNKKDNAGGCKCVIY